MNFRFLDIALHRVAPADAVRRGRELFLKDSVRLISVEPERLVAEVQAGKPQNIVVRKRGHEVEFTCSCGIAGGRCEHVAALVYELQHRQGSHAELAPDPSSRVSGNGSPYRPSRNPKWAKHVARLIDSSSIEPSHSRDRHPPWKLAYALQVHRGKRKITPLRIRVRKDGADGQVSTLQHLSPQELDGLSRDDRLIIDRLSPGIEVSIEEETGAELAQAIGPEKDHGLVRDHYRWHDLMLLLEGKEIYLETRGSVRGRRLSIDSRPGTLAFSVSDSGGELSFYPEIEWPDGTLPVSDDMTILSLRPLWVLVDDKVRLVGNAEGEELLRLKQMATPLVVPTKDRDLFLSRAFPALSARFAFRSSGNVIQTVDSPPTPRLYLSESRGELLVRLRFAYGEGIEISSDAVAAETPEIHFSGPAIVTVKRDRALEDAARSRLAGSGLREAEQGSAAFRISSTVEPLAWITERLPELAAAGFEIYGQENLTRYRVRNGPSSIAFTVASGIDWFDLNVDATFEGTPASLHAFVEAVREGRRYVRLTDGSYGVLPEDFLKKFKAAALLGDTRQGGLRLSRTHVALLDDLSEGMELTGDEGFRQYRDRLHSFIGISHPSLPEGFSATLRPYQQGGYDWLRFLHEFGFGGLLADDMGLGKTVQALALLSHVHAGHNVRPSLIIVPTSLVHNWQREAERFAPVLRVLAYHGLDRKHVRDSFESYDLIVSSYGILRRDIEFLRNVPFTYVILDESQNIKNFASVNARAARHLQAEHRLALTGTPVENNLTELWSQLHFLNPGLLGGLKTFTDHYIRAIERDRDENTAASLRRILHPFLLRRTKELVAAELPPKFESVVLCDMEELQRSAYHHWREYYRQAILRSIDTVGVKRSTVKVLEGLTKLRLVCCHPSLADERYRGGSGKFSAFEDMLDDILQEGHKVLVFSQFVRMLSILRHHLDHQKIPYEYLDGRTLNRKVHVDRFQDDPSVKAFLISLRAGGTGLNLTAADYVLHYDPWWNPAVEAQATDRTHRIGQNRQVFSYKLITRDSVEEKILELQEKKKHLVSSVITTEPSFVKSLTREEIEDLFSS